MSRETSVFLSFFRMLDFIVQVHLVSIEIGMLQRKCFFFFLKCEANRKDDVMLVDILFFFFFLKGN